MKFWDTSALTPLVLDEPKSRAARLIMLSDANCAVSFITRVELHSAVTRRLKFDDLETKHAASRFLAALENGWTVADDYDTIIIHARRLASVHGLRGADAIQLASALSLRTSEAALPFVTLDDELIAAARAEGFPVLP